MNRIWKGRLSRKNLQWATGALGLLPIGLAVFSVPVFAQIVPDNTLGNESSQVTPNVNIRGLPAERIDGGAVRGSALFHSFSEFNVNNGQRVYFSNPAGIADIFSRVTGSNVSNILGTLGVDGGANLFLLNPNGILFGLNAQLDIQGSFLATAGSSFKFSDGSEFSATQPQAAPLLSINVTPGVQWGANYPGATITNRGNLRAGQDLTLAGGNLDVQGQLQAGRDVTLFAQDSLIVRDIDTSRSDGGNGGNITLSAANGNITVTGNLNSSSSSSSGNSGNGGAITLSTTNGNISTGELNSYSRSESDAGNTGNGGAITLSTTNGNISTGNLYSDSSSAYYSLSLPSNAGNGGAITLSTTNGDISTQRLVTATFSMDGNAGNGGAITVSTTNGDISTDELRSDSYSSNGNSRNGGAMALSTTNGDISTGRLSSASISYSESSSSNSGNGGAITLFTTNGNISLEEIDSASYSYLFTFPFSQASSSGSSGDGGAINLFGSNILIKRDLKSFSYSHSGNSGRGGDIYLSAIDGDIQGIPYKDKEENWNPEKGGWTTEVRFPALNSVSVSPKRISGNGGNVTLEAKNNVSNLQMLTLSSSSESGTVQVRGFGDLSLTNINIVTSKQLTLDIPFAGKITLDVSKTGRSGDVTVNSLGNLTFNNSRIESDTKGSDPAGNVTINSLGLVTFNNSQIINNTSSTGQAGSISVSAPEIWLDSDSTLSAKTSSSGRAGDVNLQPYAGGQTLSVFFQDGAEISASSTSSGQGGNILVTAPQSVTLSGNGTLTAETSGSSRAGNVEITTPTLNVNGGAKVSTTTTSTVNTGAGGDITVKANTLNLSGANSGLFAETKGAANAGNLTLNPYSGGKDLQVNFAEGAKVSASTSGSGQGGSLNVTAPNSLTLRGNGQLSAEATQGGNAGNLQITANQLTLRDGASATVSSTGGGIAGKLAVSAPEVILENSARLAATTEAGSGGDIQLQNLSSLQLRNNSEISASTVSGKGGSVSVNAQGGTVALTGNSYIQSEANGGNAGNLNITANQLRLRDRSSATVSSTGGGTAGKLAVSAPEVILEYSAKLAATTQAGSGGDIQLKNLSSLRLSNHSEISASTASGTGGSVSVNAPRGTVGLTENSSLKAEAIQGGQAGNLDITANQLTLREGSQATVSSPQGQAGNLSITANNLLLDEGRITAETGKRSDQGGANIKLQVTDLLLLRHQSLISANATGDANGGNITISAPFVVAVPYENSDIIANAFSGDGGQINIINNYRVFGLKPQSRQSFDTLRKNRTSDISASSQSGNQGNINIQSLSIDPSQGLTQLPVEVIDPSRQIVNGCGASSGTAANAQGEFVITGRGGLPPSPDDMQTSGAIPAGWVTRDGGNSSRSAAPVEPPATPSTLPLVEAQGMFINAKGEVVLTAQTSTTTPHQPGFADKFCSPARR